MLGKIHYRSMFKGFPKPKKVKCPKKEKEKKKEETKYTLAFHAEGKKVGCSATLHGWKDVDFIIRSVVVEEEEDDDNLLNEGFRHYSIINDDE